VPANCANAAVCRVPAAAAEAAVMNGSPQQYYNIGKNILFNYC